MHSIGASRIGEYLEETAALARLAVPVALSQLGMMLLSVVDLVMLGRLEEGEGAQGAIAAISLGHTYSFGLMILGMGALMVLDPVVAQAWSAREHDRVAAALHRGCVLALLFSAIVGIAIGFAEPLLLVLSKGSTAAPLAYEYAVYLIPGLPAYFLFSVVRQTLQAMSITRPLVVAVIAGNVANAILDWGLIFGNLGMPKLGVAGAAIATSIGRYVMLAVLVFAALPALAPVLRRPDRSIFDPRPYGPLLRRGFHIGVQIALEVWVFNAVGILMIRMGTLESAGHTVALNLASVSFMIPLGIGAAAATRVGNAVGRGDVPAARRSAYASLAAGASVMVVSASLFMLAPGLLARLYTDDLATIGMAVLLIPLAAVFQIFDGTQAVGCGILRGAGDTRAAMIINLIGYWVIGLPLGLLLAHPLGLGPRGLWWGLVIGLAAVAVMLVLRVRDKIGRAQSIARI